MQELDNVLKHKLQ